MSIYLAPGNRRYRHQDITNDPNAPYHATVSDNLPHPLSRYRDLAQGCPCVIIVSPYGTGYKVFGQIIPRGGTLPRIDYYRKDIKIPITHGYPVVTIDYAIVPRDVFDRSDRVIVKSRYYPSSHHPGNQIPHILYQSFNSLVVPTKINRIMERMRSIYSDFEYRYYTDRECEQFLIDNFEPQVVNAYRNLYPGAYRSDLWRACQLYITGGFYVDIKLFAVESMQSIIDNHELMLVIDGCEYGIYNAIMACIPRHPYMKLVIDNIISNINEKSYGKPIIGPYHVSGPGPAYLAFNKYTGEEWPLRTGSRGAIYLSRLRSDQDQYATIGRVRDDDCSKIYFYMRDPDNIMSDDDATYCNGKDHYTICHRERRIYCN